jgi:outer membrane protein assembly factor BamB
VSRAHFNPRFGYLVAVNPDLSPRWTASLGERFHDGCGVPASEGGVLPPDGAPGGCRTGSLPGVDPQTNRAGSGRVIDESTASPVVAPDGSVFFGVHTRYNYSRGHLMKFSSSGTYLAAYDFGWDITPAVDARGGGYSIIVKDNHYPGIGSYCANERVCGQDPEANGHAISRLRGDTLAVEWSVRSPEGAEWCINAPAVDRNGTTYALNEDGAIYAIASDGAIRKRLPLKQPLGAAYTPLSLDGTGRIYAQNAGHLFVLGR